MKQVTDLPEDDIGTIEAGLALIPTTLFFLLLSYRDIRTLETNSLEGVNHRLTHNSGADIS